MRLSKEISRSAVVLAAGLTVGGMAHAAIWTGAGDATWASADNWSIDSAVVGDVIPPGQNGSASFGGVGSMVTMGADQTISKMAFSQAGSNWIIGGSGKLTLRSFDFTPFDTGNSGAGGDQPAVMTIADSSTVTVNAPFTAYSHWDGGRTQLDLETGSTLRLNGALGGSKWVTKKGAGTLELNNSSGTIPSLEIAGGTVKVLGAASPVPTNAQVTVAAGTTLDIQSATLACGVLSVASGGTVTNSTATMRSLRTQSWGNQTISGSITGNLSVTWRADDKMTTIAGPQTYAGSTTVSTRMVLMVTNTTGSATGAGSVSVQDNAVIAGIGNIDGIVTLSPDGTGDTNTYGAILRPTSATDALSLGGIVGAATGALDLVAMTGLDPAMSYQIVTYGGSAIAGFGTTLNQPLTHDVSYVTAGQIWLMPVPEPGVIGMLAGVVALGLTRRRRA